MTNYRHGDISFHSIKKPEGIKEIKFNGEYVLAVGEATGHYHLLTADKNAVKLYHDKKGALILWIDGKAVVTHEEHKEKILAPGWHRLGNEREFNYFANSTERVVD